MNNRTVSGLLIGCGALLALICACMGGVVTGAAGTRALSESGAIAPVGAEGPPTTEIASQFKVFWEAWAIVQREYVDKSALDSQTMTYGAINGMIDSLGDVGHTRFMTPEESRFQNQEIQGSFTGIGAEVGTRNGQIVIIAPLEDSPAERAGIRAGDIIMEVNGESTEGLTVSDVVGKVRGPAGTDVTLTVINPEGGEARDITITRAEIQTTAASWTMLPGNVAYIRMSQFSSDLHNELTEALREAQSQGAERMLVDVRNNPGGLVNQVVNVTSEFLEDGVIFIERDSEGNEEPYRVNGGASVPDLPMVVLINNGSASAAEIFAGALKSAGRATLVGETTFGTGTVLRPFALSDGSSILLGIAEWLTPEGDLIKGNGVEPDVAVEMPITQAPSSPRELQGLTQEQILALPDTQLVEGYRQIMP